MLYVERTTELHAWNFYVGGILIVSRCLLISCIIVGSQVLELGLNLDYAIHNCAVKKLDSSSHAHDLRDHAHWLAARALDHIRILTYTDTYYVTTPIHHDLWLELCAQQKAMASGGPASLNAIVIGGTGATGRCLLGSLLKAKVR